jgi:glycosyltransferase involved in cell wall biosynthesis
MPVFRIHAGEPDTHMGRLERSPRVALETDASSVETIPAPVRAAVDPGSVGTLNAWKSGKPPRGADGVVTWLAGDQLLSGSPASIRHALRFPGRRSFVPVHLPGFDVMPLLALQPRWLCSGQPNDYWDFSIRLASSAPASSEATAALRSNTSPWVELSLALLSESETPGRGIESLERLWGTRQRLPAMFSSLALRNLIVLLIRQRETARAERFLDSGLQTFPAYAELSYLAAWLHIRENRAGRAVPYLERAKTGDRGFLGCGGESSYRADWLFGLVALRVGNERMAFDHFRSGLLANPAFLPAVEQMLQLRLPPRLVAAHETEFEQAAWRNPALHEKIFDFLLRHRAFEAAGQLIDQPITARYLSEDSKQRLRDRLREATAPYHSNRDTATNVPAGILFAGPFFEHTSLGRINREVAAGALSASPWTVRLEPSLAASAFPRLFPNGDLIESAILGPLAHLNLTVRHQWPPDFRRPDTGKLAVILPWEYGAVPRAWVREIESNVDELWVPSYFVHDVLRRSGVIGTPIEVIPNGFDPSVFAPQGLVSRPLGCRKFAFLFVGGAIRRKGIDVLLKAYRMAFDPGEDVTLIAHISGFSGSYRHNSLIQVLQDMAADPQAPHLQILSNTLDDATLASLYRGCDAFVLPYRGEGFGMPLLEAMACGKPVITTAAGPARDFCDEKISYFVPAREEAVPDDPPPLGAFAGKFTWFEPDLRELARLLRHVYTHPQEAADRGRDAAGIVRKKYTWERIARMYRARIAKLAETKSISASDQARVSPT